MNLDDVVCVGDASVEQHEPARVLLKSPNETQPSLLTREDLCFREVNPHVRHFRRFLDRLISLHLGPYAHYSGQGLPKLLIQVKREGSWETVFVLRELRSTPSAAAAT